MKSAANSYNIAPRSIVIKGPQTPPPNVPVIADLIWHELEEDISMEANLGESYFLKKKVSDWLKMSLTGVAHVTGIVTSWSKVAMPGYHVKKPLTCCQR